RWIESYPPIVAGDEVSASIGTHAVERRMPVLDEAGAVELTVALRIPCVVPVAEGIAVVAAKPDVVRLRIPDDAEDVAELFATSWFVENEAGPAEDVVVDDGQLARGIDPHAIGIAALVD